MSTGKNTGLLVAAGYLYRCILTLLCGYFLLVEPHGVEDGLAVTALGPKKVANKKDAVSTKQRKPPTVRELVRLEARIAKLGKENGRLKRTRGSDESRQNDKLKAQVTELQTALDNMQLKDEQNTELTNQLSEKLTAGGAAVKKLEQENAKLTAEINLLRKQIKDLPAQQNRKNENPEESKEPATDLKEEKKQLMAANKSLRAEVQNLSEQNGDLSKRHERDVEKNKQLLSKQSKRLMELENKGNEVEPLKTKLGELQKLYDVALNNNVLLREYVVSQIEAIVPSSAITQEALQKFVKGLI